jgi:hypothetical protein
MLKTPYGNPVTALEAGAYTLVVTDRSARANVHIVGPGVNAKTTIKFRGNVTWTLTLRPGTYRYGTDRHRSKLRSRFDVLALG